MWSEASRSKALTSYKPSPWILFTKETFTPFPLTGNRFSTGCTPNLEAFGAFWPKINCLGPDSRSLVGIKWILSFSSVNHDEIGGCASLLLILLQGCALSVLSLTLPKQALCQIRGSLFTKQERLFSFFLFLNKHTPTALLHKHHKECSSSWL